MGNNGQNVGMLTDHAKAEKSNFYGTNPIVQKFFGQKKLTTIIPVKKSELNELSEVGERTFASRFLMHGILSYGHSSELNERYIQCSDYIKESIDSEYPNDTPEQKAYMYRVVFETYVMGGGAESTYGNDNDSNL